MFDLSQFVEKYHLALESAIQSNHQGGLCGFELEWNMLDSQFRPLRTVGTGPGRQSFVDYLRAEALSPWVRQFSQLEVFHWMIEWATRPYYSPRGAVYEGRLWEGVLINALHQVGRRFGERLYAWHGNLLYQTEVGHDTIPYSWHLAKRRYLERCVDLHGAALATAGTHSNLSLPDPLFAWDFVHLSPTERGDSHLDAFKSEFYITATRLMRAFAALFIATSASTPLQAQMRDGRQVVVLTEWDSVRNLTFPNPPALDVPNLYRSYEDYLEISYDLVRRGIRFGNNNWTPVRARSFAEPVERLILVTSEQLQELYARGLYAVGEASSVEEMAHQIEIQNLLARINIPMARVEVRNGDGGNSFELDIANITLKHLLLLRFYADQTFGRSFRYDREDIQRARRNETLAAKDGLRAEIENPFTGKPMKLREFLGWTLAEVQPLAEALGFWRDLQPLQEMACGAPNTAERLRARLKSELGEHDEVPLDLLRTLAEEREAQVAHDISFIVEDYSNLGEDVVKVDELLQHVRDDVRQDLEVPIRFRPRLEALLEVRFADKTSEIIALAEQLIRIPSVTACPNERLEEVRRAAAFIVDYLRDHGLGVRYYDQGKYPAILVGFPGQMKAPVMLSGHFDVVAPEPDDSQFEPRIEGDYLWGRGSADMKTVVATYLVWMKDTLHQATSYPPINLLLIGNEENGEGEPMGTPHVLKFLAEDEGYSPSLLIAGERTGERGDEQWGEVCTQNRGVMRFDVIARGQRGHSGLAGSQTDLMSRLFEARNVIHEVIKKHLTLSGNEGWVSQVNYPFIQVGTPGVYNITADYAVLGVEVRPIPQDDLNPLLDEIRAYCQSQSLELSISVMENGIACDPENPYLKALIRSIQQVSGQSPRLGRKLPATSARFAPHGQGVVWGQSGIAPHGREERHFIPSILPYYQALQEFGKALLIHSEFILREQTTSRGELG